MRSLDKSDSGQLAVQGSHWTRPCDLGSGTARGKLLLQLFVINQYSQAALTRGPFYPMLRYVLCVSLHVHYYSTIRDLQGKGSAASSSRLVSTSPSPSFDNTDSAGVLP
jgi:hypothetical protein